MKKLLSLLRRYWWAGAIVLVLLVGLWIGRTLSNQQIQILGYSTSLAVKDAMELYADNRLDEAATKYQSIVKDHPRDLVAWNNLGNVLRDLGRSTEAEAAYRRVIELDPRAGFVYRNLVTLYQLWPNEAERQTKLLAIDSDIQLALRLKPNDADVLDAAIVYYRELGNTTRANELQAKLTALPGKSVSL